jgi:hypothetical protein
MYRITMDVLCLDGYSEVLPNDGENTELVVEDLVSLILLDIFGIVTVEGVKATYTLATERHQSYCVLQIRVTSPIEAIEFSQDMPEGVEARVEDAISCALIELFNTVLINRLVVSREEQRVASYSHKA